MRAGFDARVSLLRSQHHFGVRKLFVDVSASLSKVLSVWHLDKAEAELS